MVHGQRNKYHNDYKLNAVVCVKDDAASNSNPSTSPLRSSLFHPSNESQIVPADIGSSRLGALLVIVITITLTTKTQALDNQNQNKLQQKIEKLQSRIDKAREQSRSLQLFFYIP